MAQQLRKFVNRAPRYTLRVDDDYYLRFVPEKGGRKEPQTTRILNLSSSGLAFAVAQPCNLHLGETIKLEFPVPGAGRVAWWGKVVRLEELRSRYSWWGKGNSSAPLNPEVLVAITYVALPEGHSRKIRDGLNKKFTDYILAERQRSRQQLLTALYENSWKILVWGICTAITLIFLYALSRPSGNYTPEHGSQWGQRVFDWSGLFDFFTGNGSSQK